MTGKGLAWDLIAQDRASVTFERVARCAHRTARKGRRLTMTLTGILVLLLIVLVVVAIAGRL